MNRFGGSICEKERASAVPITKKKPSIVIDCGATDRDLSSLML